MKLFQFILTTGLLSSIAMQPFQVTAQVTPLIEVQGQTDSSPYESQEITISGKVTESFGDTWYMQDDFGAWNGIYVVGPDIAIESNPPYWNGDRQPEVGDVLEITGMVVEADGNTQINDAVLVNFVDFWNATPIGIWLTCDVFQDEQYEGTRVRVDNATILSAPDVDGYWIVTDGTAEITCWGLDTYNPSDNDDEDGPSPGDVYQIYGSMHQAGDEYVLHVGDIDVLSLSLDEEYLTTVYSLYPNPASNSIVIDGVSEQIMGQPGLFTCTDVQGKVVFQIPTYLSQPIDISIIPKGIYHAEWIPSGTSRINFEIFSGELVIQ
jgi:hypothetical protein